MSDDGPQCAATNQQGEPCGQMGNINPVNSLCLWHDPTRRKEAKEIRRRSQRTLTERNRSSKLTTEDLPPLTSHEAAEVWLDRIGRAVATGELSGTAGATALRAATSFKDVRAAGEQADKVAELEQKVALLEGRSSPLKSA